MNLAPIKQIISSAQNICVIKPDALGDFLLATPALKKLREMAPQAKITLLVSPYVHQLAQGLTCVDVVLGVKLLQAQEKTPQLLQATARAINQVAGPFDVALVMRWDTDWYGATPLAHGLGAQYRIGYSLACLPKKSISTPGYDALLTHTLDDKSITHEVLKNMQLVGLHEWPVNFAGIDLGQNEVVRAGKLPSCVTKEPFYGVAISCTRETRKLTVPNWVRLIEAVKSTFGLRVLVFAGPTPVDLQQGALIAAQTYSIDTSGQFNPLQTIAALTYCRGMIAVDSFIKHAAAFVGVPVVELCQQSKLGNPEAEWGGVRFGAYGVKTQIIKPDAPLADCEGAEDCQSPFSHCINHVRTDEVLQAVQEVFELKP